VVSPPIRDVRAKPRKPHEFHLAPPRATIRTERLCMERPGTRALGETMTDLTDPTRREYRMPFGTRLQDDGSTRFRLWAPAVRRVELWLDDLARGYPMTMNAEGWAEIITGDAPVGSRYRFRIDDELLVPDPASRFQPDDVHGPSEVIDPRSHVWHDGRWTGIPAERLVFYELHVGTFTPAGTFAGIAEKLDHLASLGVTAIELMPVADFPGRWGWGYDGVLPFAPDSRYGRPEALKALVEACHERGLAVFLDVVYNHFGPEGNYLHHYAPVFFNPHRHTPWGDAINFDGAGSHVVRAFFIDNALYWLEEYHLDGLRLDSVHAMADTSASHVLTELAHAVAEGPGRDRAVHLVLENNANEARYLERRGPRGRRLYQWNDDLHHALHVLLTGEGSGYYQDYHPPLAHLRRCLAEGFAYQGDYSGFQGRLRGESSGHLPPTAFIGFLQNHDQVGNRAFGERITTLASADAVRAATAVLLLAPSLPLLFMGQEWAAREPFLFFSDLGPDLGPRVSEGRKREFARFPAFARPDACSIPDPQAPESRERSALDWSWAGDALHQEWVAFHRGLLRLREREIAPLTAGETVPEVDSRLLGETSLEIVWSFSRPRALRLVANLGAQAVMHEGPDGSWGRRLYALGLPASRWAALPPWSVGWFLSETGDPPPASTSDASTRDE
jgi:maltooligosyltrehalose trehalohydrolase